MHNREQFLGGYRCSSCYGHNTRGVRWRARVVFCTDCRAGFCSESCLHEHHKRMAEIDANYRREGEVMGEAPKYLVANV
jgi:hypothetical protein